ncbi:MAG: hypothetical protein QN131_14460, partial [Armatimonadota bacterium]|nr:hypothetical protein [Armatimonadota bacterium]
MSAYIAREWPRAAQGAGSSAEGGRHRAVETYGIALLQVMENAGRTLAELARRMVGGSCAQGPNPTIVSGRTTTCVT